MENTVNLTPQLALTESSPFKEQAEAHKNIGDGSGQKGHGESGGHQLPSDGSNNGGDQGTKKTSVEQGLDAITDTKDILISLFQFNGCDWCLKKQRGEKYDYSSEQLRYGSDVEIIILLPCTHTSSNNEKAECDTHLTSHHESRQVASISFKENITSALGP